MLLIVFVEHVNCIEIYETGLPCVKKKIEKYTISCVFVCVSGDILLKGPGLKPGPYGWMAEQSYLTSSNLHVLTCLLD